MLHSRRCFVVRNDDDDDDDNEHDNGEEDDDDDDDASNSKCFYCNKMRWNWGWDQPERKRKRRASPMKNDDAYFGVMRNKFGAAANEGGDETRRTVERVTVDDVG